VRLSETPIEPIRKTRVVPIEQAAAFELFTAGMGRWWPVATHSIAASDGVDVVFDGRIGGIITEIAPSGEAHVWAEVIAWDPPNRFAISWHPSVGPTAASIVDVRFRSVNGGTQVDLEHRGWEELGAVEGVALRDGYTPGWDLVLHPFETLAGEL
jgi:hypothetical protein